MTSLLLDTDALIWWDANDPRLGGRARAAIKEADDVFISAASAWEVVIKTARGKLRTTRQPRQIAADSGFGMLPISFDHVEAVSTLGAHHGDPFDRVIIATAKIEQLTILTSDQKFWRYDVPLIDARR